MTTQYTSVKIPNILADRIREVMLPLGYRSVSEFVMDATRRLLQKIEDRMNKIIQKCRWNEHNFRPILMCTICNYYPITNYRGSNPHD